MFASSSIRNRGKFVCARLISIYVLLGTVLALPSLVRADITNTITINDLDEAIPCPTLPDKTRMTCTLLGVESVEIKVDAPTGSVFHDSDLNSGGIADPNGIFVSDFTRFTEIFTNGQITSIIFNFDSDPFSSNIRCADLNKPCFLTEDGTPQQVGQITWSDANGFTTDVFKIKSDVEGPELPEPGSQVLLGAGLIGVVGVLRRRR